jgi:hypothetical protein
MGGSEGGGLCACTYLSFSCLLMPEDSEEDGNDGAGGIDGV